MSNLFQTYKEQNDQKVYHEQNNNQELQNTIENLMNELKLLKSNFKESLENNAKENENNKKIIYSLSEEKKY